MSVPVRPISVTAIALLLLMIASAMPAFAQTNGGFRESAEQGDVTAQFQLGVQLEHGLGLAKDDREAAQWYQNAADQGHPGAQNNLAVMFSGGRGVPQSSKRAEFWLKKSAEQGHARAQYNLALLTQKRGQPKDLKEAYAWLSVSAANGFELAFIQRDRLTRWMNPVWTAQAQELAMQYWQAYKAVNTPAP